MLTRVNGKTNMSRLKQEKEQCLVLTNTKACIAGEGGIWEEQAELDRSFNLLQKHKLIADYK